MQFECNTVVMLWLLAASSCTQGFVSSFLSYVVCPEIAKMSVIMNFLHFVHCVQFIGSYIVFW